MAVCEGGVAQVDQGSGVESVETSRACSQTRVSVGILVIIPQTCDKCLWNLQFRQHEEKAKHAEGCLGWYELEQVRLG